MGLVDAGTVKCPICGASTSADDSLCKHCDATLATLSCPRCRIEMRPASIGVTAVSECERCMGLWLDVPSFERICAYREERAAVLGATAHAPVQDAYELKVRYSPCPKCEQLMNRINFDRSGVVVDICKGHGIWFDRDELTRITEFIHAGKLGKARNRHKTELEQERIRTHRAMTTRFELGTDPADRDYPWYHTGVAIASVADILSLLRD